MGRKEIEPNKKDQIKGLGHLFEPKSTNLQMWNFMPQSIIFLKNVLFQEKAIFICYLFFKTQLSVTLKFIKFIKTFTENHVKMVDNFLAIPPNNIFFFFFGIQTAG